MSDNRVFARDLSPKVLSSVNVALQSDASLAPERLGELLVAVESKGGQNKLAGDAIKRILRGALMIRGFEPASGGAQSDLNVIARICEPFMHRQLDAPEFEKARKKFINDFRKVAERFESLSKVIPQKEWTTSPKMKKLMDSVMKPVMELICGKANNLDSSALPEVIKKALLSIDKYVIAWFQKSGTGKPADLLSARKNALIGFLATRSLSYVWLTKAKEEKSIDEAHLTRLISYMNSYVSSEVNDFVTDVLLKQTEQPTEARKYIEVMTNKSTLKSKPSVPKLALGFGTPLAGEKVLSARSRAPISTSRLAEGNAPTDKAAEKKAKEALMKMRVERAILVDKIAKESGIDKIDHNFYQYVKEIVVKTAKRGFDNFKNDPVKSLIKYADKYYAKIENHKQVKDGLPAKVRSALDAYSLKLLKDGLPAEFKTALETNSLKSISNPFEEQDHEVKSSSDTPSEEQDHEDKSSSATPSVKSLMDEDSVETEHSDETEIETESSEDDKQS